MYFGERRRAFYFPRFYFPCNVILSVVFYFP